MNYKIPLVVLLGIVLLGVVPVGGNAMQGQSTALERGYRTGYSDGYTSGFRDAGDKARRDFENKEEYQKADRSFNDVWGPIEDYRDGYQQGFQSGYDAGYDGQQFNSALPLGLKRRPLPDSRTNSGGAMRPDNSSAQDNGDINLGSPNGSLAMPRNTILTLELITPLSTDATQRGDRFQARVIQPSEYAGAIVEGRVTQVKRPGKVKGVAELQLSFEQLRSADNRTTELHAELLEVLPSSGVDTDVDREGGVKGRDSTKDDVSKVGAASGIGAIIGAIAGGGKGAAIGAVIGGGAGTAGVMTQRGKDIRLDRGQQLKIRTSADTSAP